MQLEKLIKRIGIIVMIISITLLIGSVLIQRHCAKTSVVPGNPYVIPEQTYTPPILPIFKNKQPVKTENLPIPKKEVARTIEITPTKEADKITIIEDKKGNLYVSKDTKVEKIEVVKWKPGLFNFKYEPGLSVFLHDSRIFYALSFDVFNIREKLYFGGDAGLAWKQILLGASLRFRFLPCSDTARRIPIYLSLGYDFFNSRAYVGLTLKMR